MGGATLKNKRITLGGRLFYLLIGLPILLIIVLVLHYGVNVPFWDGWEMVPLFQKHDAGTLGFSDLWAQHNEHRILFPNLLLYGLATLTHWSPYGELFLNLIFGLGILLVILLLLRRTFKPNNFLLPLISIIAAWLIVSPVQSENWLWGWQIEWFLSVGAVCLTVFLLTKKSKSSFILAALSATVATYSLADGLLVWFIGLLLLIALQSQIRKIILWLVLGLSETYLYYHNYVNPGYEPSKTLWLHQPQAFIHYVLVYLGKPLGPSVGLAAIAGTLLLVVLTASLVYLSKQNKQRLDGIYPWLALGIYGFGSAVLTAISRVGFGATQAFSSRYSTVSNLFTLAVIVITAIAIKEYLSNKKINYKPIVLISSCVVMAALAVNFVRGVDQMKHQHSQLIAASQCLQTVSSANNPCLLLAYPNTEVEWQRLQFLRRVHWGGF